MITGIAAADLNFLTLAKRIDQWWPRIVAADQANAGFCECFCYCPALCTGVNHLAVPGEKRSIETFKLGAEAEKSQLARLEKVRADRDEDLDSGVFRAPC